MHRNYLEFLRQASQKSLPWWCGVVVLGVVSAVITVVGETPGIFRQYWYWWVIFGLVGMFFAVNYGAFVLYREQHDAYEARITELKRTNDAAWDAKVEGIQHATKKRELEALAAMIDRRIVEESKGRGNPPSFTVSCIAGWFTKEERGTLEALRYLKGENKIQSDVSESYWFVPLARTLSIEIG